MTKCINDLYKGESLYMNDIYLNKIYIHPGIDEESFIHGISFMIQDNGNRIMRDYKEAHVCIEGNKDLLSFELDKDRNYSIDRDKIYKMEYKENNRIADMYSNIKITYK